MCNFGGVPLCCGRPGEVYEYNKVTHIGLSLYEHMPSRMPAQAGARSAEWSMGSIGVYIGVRIGVYIGVYIGFAFGLLPLCQQGVVSVCQQHGEVLVQHGTARLLLC